MLSWLEANMGSIVVVLILVLLCALIIRSMYNDKKQGKSTCGCNCAHCAMAGQCHGHTNKKAAH